MLRTGLAALIPLALLALLAVLLSEPAVARGSKQGLVVEDAHLRAILDTIGKTPVASGLATVLLVLLAWLFRRAMLAWLVWRPGRIEVPALEGDGVTASAEIAELSAIFRERLALLRLQSSSPAPGAAPEGAFLDVIEGASSSDPVSAVVRLIRAAVPRYALTVQGVLRKRDDAEAGFGVTVQVVQQPSQASPVIEFWESSWQEAARKAADGVTAAILPRTRLCVGPWAGWRGYLMPPALLIAYERGAAHEQAREFDQARDQYWEALRRDPTNLTIRLSLGQLQEKAGNPLAALTNYVRIMAFANPGRKLAPRGLYRRDARRQCERVVALAKYRAIVLLGDGAIIEQWSLTPAYAPATGHGDAMAHREALRKEFENLLVPLAQAARRDPGADAIAKATRTVLEQPLDLDEAKLAEARKQLLIDAYRAATELKLSLSRIEVKPWSRPLSRRTVDLTQICLEQRHRLIAPGATGREDLRDIENHVRWSGARPGFWALWWPSWLRRWQWHEHYNAACVYALALRGDLSRSPHAETRSKTPGEKAPTPQDAAANRAIGRLERAITTRDSGLIDTWRDWMVREDPDLVDLRKRPEFTAFKETYFPSDGPPYTGVEAASAVAQASSTGVAEARATGATSHEASGAASRTPTGADHQALERQLLERLYTRDLLRAIAKRRQSDWSSLASSDRPESTLREWLRHERMLWRDMHEVVRKPSDWRVRQQLTERLDPPGTRARPLAVPFLRHEQLDEKVRSDPQLVDGLNALLDARIARLQKELTENDGRRPGALVRWIEQLDSLATGGTPLRQSRASEICECHAAVWASLGKWFEVEDTLAETIAGNELTRALPPSRWATTIEDEATRAWDELGDTVKFAHSVSHAALHGWEAKLDRARRWVRRRRLAI